MKELIVTACMQLMREGTVNLWITCSPWGLDGCRTQRQRVRCCPGALGHSSTPETWSCKTASKQTPVTRAVAVGRKLLVWSNSGVDLVSVPERSNVTQWVWLLGEKRAISWPGSGTRCSAVPYAPAEFLHRQLGSEVKRMHLGMTGGKATVTTSDKKGHWLCRWLPGVRCWKRSYPAGSDPPPRARGSTSHENLSTSVRYQAEERWQNVQMSKPPFVCQSAPRFMQM